MGSKRRHIDILIISDVHLGTYGCRAKELLQYLKSVKPRVLILNGDIIDIWQFSKNFWPSSHMKVVKQILNLVSKGTDTYYITGNHDEMLRKFAGFKMGSLQIVNKLLLPLNNEEKAWIFHGDVFDLTMQHSKWLAKLGAVGYDALILLNAFANFISEKILKKGKLSFSKKIKNSVKSAVKFINNFEETCAEIGIMNKYDYVICGHIHHPEIKVFENAHGSIKYLNSGDWIENLSALEYVDGKWSIFRYDHQEFNQKQEEEEISEIELSQQDLFKNLMAELNVVSK